MTITIERMWEGGPLRQVSDKSRQGWSRGQNAAFKGRYVCDECLRPVAGVYEPKDGFGDGRKWLCSACRAAQRPRIPQPESLVRLRAL